MITHCEKYQDWGFLFVRIVAGAIFVLAGWGKVFSGGAAGLAGAFAGTWLALPAVAWTIVGVIELLGGLLLLAGLFMSWNALVLAVIMLVASIVQWAGMLGGNGGFAGARLDILLFAVLVLLSMTGAGKLSADGVWCKPKTRPAKRAKK